MGIEGQHHYRLQIGNYRLLKKISTGTSGIVYQGQHNVFDDEPLVAIKILRAPLNSPGEQEGFMREARLLRKLKHKHILPIIDAGTSLGFPYIVMEYAAGGSLRELLERNRRFSLQETARLLSQLAAALQYAHDQGVVHRDLKPENILFSAQGEIRLADFGIAVILVSSRTQRSGVGGTPFYMAPEQFEGIISTRGDQYALGCIAYEMLTGRRVFDPSPPTPLALLYHHHKVDPVPPGHYNSSLPLAAEKAILRALAKQRADRFPDVKTFAETLSAIAFPESSSSQPLSTTSATLPAITPTSEHPLMTADDPQARLEQGKNYLNQHKYVAALAAYTKALRYLPTSAVAWTGKGDAHFGMKHYEKALEDYAEALRLDPRFIPAWHGKGKTLRELGRYEESLVAFLEASRLDPQCAVTHRNRGDVLVLQKRYEEALLEYEEALAINPEDAESWQNKGQALCYLRLYPDALLATEQALALDPELPSARQNKELILKAMRTRGMK
jgi:serine/threonine protein kinase